VILFCAGPVPTELLVFPPGLDFRAHFDRRRAVFSGLRKGSAVFICSVYLFCRHSKILKEQEEHPWN